MATAVQKRQRELQLAAQQRAAAQRVRNTAMVTTGPGKGAARPQPFKPPPIPAGYYDPALDAQRQAASRGLQYTEEDIGLAGRRGQEDYDRNVGLLTRHYQDLGTAQDERANAYGVVPGGGAILQAAAKRAANQQLEQTALTTDYNRGVADRGTGLSRARSEDLFYGLDIGAQKQYQAQQARYVAPTRLVPPTAAQNRTAINAFLRKRRAR